MNNPGNAFPFVDAYRQFTIHPSHLDRARERVAKLARRAVKLGLEAPELVVVDEFLAVEFTGRLVNGVCETREVPRVVVEVRGPRIEVAGWGFVATIEHGPEGVGNALHKAPAARGVSIPVQFRRAVPWCDHCQTERRRNDTFVVRAVDGSAWKQVGRNCLRDFFGIDPTAAITWMACLVRICGELDDDEFRRMGGGRGEQVFSLGSFLPVVASLIRTDGWLSRGQARAAWDEYGDNKQSTADGAVELLTPVPGGDWRAQEAERQRRARLEAVSDVDRETADKALEWAERTILAKPIEDRAEYEQNLAVGLAKPWVDRRSLGVVASVVRAYGRAIEAEMERKATAEKVNEHVGTVGERVELTLKVTGLRSWDGDWGTTTLHRFEDGDGRLVVWFGSRGQIAGEGETVTARWKIKEHSEYKGRRQTVVTRPTKIQVAETSEAG